MVLNSKVKVTFNFSMLTCMVYKFSIILCHNKQNTFLARINSEFKVILIRCAVTWQYVYELRLTSLESLCLEQYVQNFSVMLQSIIIPHDSIEGISQFHVVRS